MNDRQHFVQAGDSPEAIAKKYGIAWTVIYEHPGNAFIKKRKGYPIHPGDRLLVPLMVGVPQPARPMGPPAMSPRFKEFCDIVEWNIKILLALQGQHPSAAKVKVHSTAPPKVDPGVQAPKAGEIVGYKKSVVGVRSSVVLTRSIESAFEVLRPSLPSGTVMTSGYRSDADQARLINNFFSDHSGPAEITDVEKRRQWLLALTVKDKNGKDTHLKIGRVGGSPHRTGLAFDLSGADIDTTDAAVHLSAPEHHPRVRSELRPREPQVLTIDH
jgi:hypothetical protein